MPSAALLADLDSPQMREAGRELLSLALIEARNRTLALFAALEPLLDASPEAEPEDELPAPDWLLGRIGWFQERWIARNLQRLRGARADASGTRLASIEPQADRWWDDAAAGLPGGARVPDGPALAELRSYLIDTLETTLDLLAACPETDEALYGFRLALFHEDRCAERLLELAQWWGVAPGALAMPVARAPRPPLRLGAGRWQLGAVPGRGFVFDNEQGTQELALPEGEIDAQPVSWAQYAEFVEDGGYDEPHWWSAAGWEWVGAQARRAPRAVEQLRSRVLLRRFGSLQQAAPGAPALHLSWHEAQAWCRWAGRRLPTEAEWERAAATLGTRGFRWGEVWEWTATPLQPYPGFAPCAGQDSPAAFGREMVLRGGSFATRPRLRHPKLRGHAPPGRDAGFCGFRSCAL